jgi:hypothetical protein
MMSIIAAPIAVLDSHLDLDSCLNFDSYPDLDSYLNIDSYLDLDSRLIIKNNPLFPLNLFDVTSSNLRFDKNGCRSRRPRSNRRCENSERCEDNRSLEPVFGASSFPSIDVFKCEE